MDPNTTFNPTYITASIAVAAILSPILTAIFNNRHQYKMKKLEFHQQSVERNYTHRKQIFGQVMNEYSLIMKEDSKSDKSRFGEVYYNALPYVPKEHLEVFRNFGREVLYGGTSDSILKERKFVNDFLPTMCVLLQEEIPLKRKWYKLNKKHPIHQATTSQNSLKPRRTRQ